MEQELAPGILKWGIDNLGPALDKLDEMTLVLLAFLHSQGRSQGTSAAFCRKTSKRSPPPSPGTRSIPLVPGSTSSQAATCHARPPAVARRLDQLTGEVKQICGRID